ncbi:putative sugar O-methyltransferase [Candidatus Pelagibacter sp.]|nr:putative sugar O-methyltransferase [Candidatus Pelagibacter sp.]
MFDITSEIIDNYNFNLKNYQKSYQSRHWKYNNKKKKILFYKKKLKNFRSNGLSKGMDDLFYSKTQSLILYKKIVNECGEKFVHSMLLKKNYGNPKKHFRAKNFVYTAHELFHIKYIYDIKKFVSLTKNSIICEIGPGYGSMIAKLKKKYNSKIILIDLPEANFISHYYLKLIFPKKKFFTSKDIKKNVSKNDILKNDVIILCPWDNLPNLKIDLFINSRSMMEMTNDTILSYFKQIHNLTKIGGYFLCINRYYKDTVGYPVEMNNYPYDNFWKVLISKTSWMQNHIHFLFTKRTKNSSEEIFRELKKIKLISENVKKKDPFFWRRILPTPVYKFYKKMKFFFI